MEKKAVIVLGASGMLGAMVTDYLVRYSSLDVTATVRSEGLVRGGEDWVGGARWKVFDADADNVWEALAVIEGHSWVVNAIGITKPLIHDDNAVEVERAVRINSLFPHLLARRARETGAQVLQIATDCVFSGRKGKYQEHDEHDALDVYGKSKSLGEVRVDNIHHLRCSIIGPEPRLHKFLLDWFLGQPHAAQVNGFVNHLWNGVTTLHFAKICWGIIAEELSLPHSQHVVPAKVVSKRELLGCFSASYGRSDVVIRPAQAGVIVDRTLQTGRPELNQALWSAAGYPQPPSIQEMISEMAAYPFKAWAS